LIHHLSISSHCSSSAPGHPIASIDCNADDNFNHDNSMSLLDEDFSGDDLAGGYDSSSSQEEVPDQQVHARALSHMIAWSTSSENDEDEVNNDDDDEQLLTMNTNKYEYYDEKDFPASPDDTAHVFLADLCHRIRAPLYAYDEILEWAQEAHLSGYCFPTNAPKYKCLLISNLRKRLGRGHLSHRTATIQKCGVALRTFLVLSSSLCFMILLMITGSLHIF
jgi:hypothetical protein